MPKLFIVPTPIGNLEDITLRALRVLKEVSIVFSEDTRVTRKLFSHYDIHTQMMSYHQHNEHKQLENYIQLIKQHEQTALVTDAGTPGISDPGYLIVKECIKEGIEVESLPGATAFVPALVNSGFPCDRFYFYGFLPHKKGRQTAITQLSEKKETFILYESPYRLNKTLEQLGQFCGMERKVSVSRELTKIYEETIRGTISEVMDYFKQKISIKGEIVIIVEGNESK